MANELQLLPNPDNVPGKASSGYQRQNTNFFASVVGLDLLRIEKIDNTLTVYGGGIVEVNGALYKVLNNISLNLDSDKNQYLALTPSGTNYITLSLTDTLGTFDNNKNGYYSGGARIINIYLSPHFVVPNNTMQTLVASALLGSTSTYQASPGWYYGTVTGGNGSPAGNGGNGGYGYNSSTSSASIYGGIGADGLGGLSGEGSSELFRIDAPTFLTLKSGKSYAKSPNGNNGTDGTYNKPVGGNGGRGARGRRGDPSSITGGNVNIIAAGGEGGIGGTGGTGGIPSTGGIPADTGDDGQGVSEDVTLSLGAAMLWEII